MKAAVVLLSGGVDSATTMAIARSQGYHIYALSFRYGQRHSIELEAAKLVAEHLGAEKQLVIDFNLRDIGGSALTAAFDVPKHDRKAGQKNGSVEGTPRGSGKRSIKSNDLSVIPATYVPARNTLFLSFALGWAEVLKAADIFIGANAVDYSGYPDCRPEYLSAFEALANLATKAGVEGTLRFRIKAPLLQMTKADIIRTGISLGLDYGLTWSCYDPQETSSIQRNAASAEAPKEKPASLDFADAARSASGLPGYRTRFSPCGRCDSCVFRARGFAEAGINDPALR